MDVCKRLTADGVARGSEGVVEVMVLVVGSAVLMEVLEVSPRLLFLCGLKRDLLLVGAGSLSPAAYQVPVAGATNALHAPCWL